MVPYMPPQGPNAGPTGAMIPPPRGGMPHPATLPPGTMPAMPPGAMPPVPTQAPAGVPGARRAEPQAPATPVTRLPERIPVQQAGGSAATPPPAAPALPPAPPSVLPEVAPSRR
jgi:hypothetical protein